MREKQRKYQIDTEENKEFLRELREDLLNFGHQFPSPGGSSYYLGDDGTPWKDRNRETWITSRMTHVYSIGTFLGHEGSEELADAGLKGLKGELRDRAHGGWYAGLTPEGKPLPNKQCYAHAFVILASSSAFLAGREGAKELLEEALKLVLVCESLKSNQRGLYLDQLQDYFLAPNGLGPKDHQKTRALLEALAPSHILALAQNCTDPWWQALFQEAQGAWADPKEAGFSYCDLEIPAKPKVEHATKLIQALGERRKLWPEPLRCLCDDLIKPLNICQPSKLHNFMEFVNALLKLNSQELLNELMILSQILPQDFGFDALIHPKEFADAGCDMHKRLQATMIAPKTKKSAVKKNAVKTAAQKKTASKKTDASKKAADKNTSAKRAGSKAKSSAGQAQVAAQQAQAVPQQTQAAAQPATPTLAAQAPADAQGAPSTQAVNAPQDSAVKRTEDPKGSSHGAGANSGLRARETIAAELAQRRARKQKELRRKHNKEARKQRKNANRRK